MLVIDVYIVVVAVAIVGWAGRELVSKNQSLKLNEVI